MKNSNDTIGNRTRDLPACGAVPQRTAPPAACPHCYHNKKNSCNSAAVYQIRWGALQWGPPTHFGFWLQLLLECVEFSTKMTKKDYECFPWSPLSLLRHAIQTQVTFETFRFAEYQGSRRLRVGEIQLMGFVTTVSTKTIWQLTNSTGYSSHLRS